MYGLTSSKRGMTQVKTRSLMGCAIPKQTLRLPPNP